MPCSRQMAVEIEHRGWVGAQLKGQQPAALPLLGAARVGVAGLQGVGQRAGRRWKLSSQAQGCVACHCIWMCLRRPANCWWRAPAPPACRAAPMLSKPPASSLTTLCVVGLTTPAVTCCRVRPSTTATSPCRSSTSRHLPAASFTCALLAPAAPALCSPSTAVLPQSNAASSANPPAPQSSDTTPAAAEIARPHLQRRQLAALRVLCLLRDDQRQQPAPAGLLLQRSGRAAASAGWALVSNTQQPSEQHSQCAVSPFEHKHSWAGPNAANRFFNQCPTCGSSNTGAPCPWLLAWKLSSATCTVSSEEPCSTGQARGGESELSFLGWLAGALY